MLSRRTLIAMALAQPRLRLSAITDEIAHTPAEAFAFCRQYNLQSIELRSVPGTKRGYWDLPAADQKSFAKECKDSGVSVSFIDSGLLAAPLPGTVPVKTPGPAEWERYGRRLDDLKRVLDLAHTVNCNQIRCFAFRRVALPSAIYPQIAETITPMVEIAAKARVRLLLENEASCNVNTCQEMTAFARLIPSEWFGLNWDPGNAVRLETAFPDGYALLPKHRIHNVQVKGRGILPNGPDPLDWKSIFQALRKDGYQGHVGLETHTPNRQLDSHAAIRALLALCA